MQKIMRDTISKLTVSATNLGLVEATQVNEDLFSTIFQLITTAVTVWYMIKKPRPKKDVNV